MPSLSLRWEQRSASPGTRASFHMAVRDAAGAAIAHLPVRYWVGPRGTEPPKDDEEWQRASKVVTDSEGLAAVTSRRRQSSPAESLASW